MGIFSRVYKNPFGGVSFAAPPSGVGSTAGAAEDLSNELSGQYLAGMGGFQALIDRANPIYDQAIAAADRRATDQQGLYDEHTKGLLEKAFRDAGRAGSRSRQAAAGERAGSEVNALIAANEAAQRRQLAAQGLTPTDNRLSATNALAETAAINSARQQERAYGEQVRLGLIPHLQQQGNEAINARTLQANLVGQQAMLPSQVARGYLPLAQSAIAGHQTAQDMYGNLWNATNSTAREQAMWDQSAFNNFNSMQAWRMGNMQELGLGTGNSAWDAAIASVPYYGAVNTGLNAFNAFNNENWGDFGGTMGTVTGTLAGGPWGGVIGNALGSWVGGKADRQKDIRNFGSSSVANQFSGVGSGGGSKKSGGGFGDFLSSFNPFS